jgi:hypothetical protein
MSNGDRAQVDWHKFNHPKIVFAEKVILAGRSDTIQQNELKVSRDMVVDYLAISDDTFTTEPRVAGPHQTFLHWIGVNWGVVERSTWIPIGFGSIEEFHNFYEGDSTNVPIDPLTGDTRTMWGALRWRHSEPWAYNPIDTLSIDLAAPQAPIAIGGVRELSVFWDAVGLKSGSRRSFVIPRSPFLPQGLGVPFSQSFSAPQLASNLGDEAFKVQSVGLGFPERAWCQTPPVDERLLNFYRMRVTPSIGDSWSDTPVPLVFYGIHQRPPWRLAIHKPVGGPIFLYAGQSIIFNIKNNATVANVDEDVNINVQVALIGRTAPGIGSLV